MLKTDVLKHFPTVVAVADSLGIRRQSVYKWPAVVPITRAVALERITKGKLKVVTRLYE